jgi:hypothetical protein
LKWLRVEKGPPQKSGSHSLLTGLVPSLLISSTSGKKAAKPPTRVFHFMEQSLQPIWRAPRPVG